jgi:TRAP-type mannitol/chloroaromatic compound transport system permease small subunit
MDMLDRISRWIDSSNERIGQAVGWLTLAMVLIGAFNALARYIGTHVGMQLGSNTWLETQWYLFATVFMLGAAATLRHDEHVRVDVLYGRLSDRGRAWVDLLGTLLLLLPFCLLSGWASWDYVMNSWESREMSPDPGGLPRYPLKAIILLTFGLLFLQGISKLIKSVLVLKGRQDS